MKDSQFLAGVSAAQLAVGLGGMTLAIRRRRAFDIPFWQGQESTDGRDSLERIYADQHLIVPCPPEP